jgi:hypothetical protein
MVSNVESVPRNRANSNLDSIDLVISREFSRINHFDSKSLSKQCKTHHHGGTNLIILEKVNVRSSPNLNDERIAVGFKWCQSLRKINPIRFQIESRTFLFTHQVAKLLKGPNFTWFSYKTYRVDFPQTWNSMQLYYDTILRKVWRRFNVDFFRKMFSIFYKRPSHYILISFT